MAPLQDPYWASRGVPSLPAEVLKHSRSARRSWRIKYVQDLFIPEGLDEKQATEWRKQNTVQKLTGDLPKGTGVPLRRVPSQARPASNAQKTSIPQATPSLPLGFTRLCIPPKKQWHNADGSVWQPIKPKLIAVGNHDTTSNQRQQDTSIQPSPKRQKTRHVVFPPAIERRLSSIPNNLSWTNGVDSFNRMAALVDDSDSELSDISSDDEVAVRPVVRGSIAESFADQINEGSPTIAKASPNSQLLTTLEEAILTEESQPPEDVTPSRPSELLGEISRIARPPKFATSSDNQQPKDSDTRIQDVVSISSDDAKVEDQVETPASLEISAPSHHGINARQDAKNFNIDAEESTQEVYEAVEEVLEDVCSSTRALPSSTSAKSHTRKGKIITRSSSRRNELVVLEPVIQQQDVAESDGDESMAEVGEEAGEQDMEGVSTDSISDDAGSNIVVAMKNAPAEQSGDEDQEMKNVQTSRRSSLNSKSSSSILEELSRSPTPPVLASHSQNPVATRRTSQRKRVTKAESPQALSASPRVIVPRISDSKRKFTGVTSKHFSKSKLPDAALTTSRQSKRMKARNGSQVDTPVPSRATLQSRPGVHSGDESDDDEIQVAVRRQSPQIKVPSNGLVSLPVLQEAAHSREVGRDAVDSTAYMQSGSSRTHVKPGAASPSKQRIAYVDLRVQSRDTTIDVAGQLSQRPIAFVDLTADTSTQPDAVPRSSPPNANDEPLEHLAKLLRTPNFAKKEKPLPAEDEPEAIDPITPSRPKRVPKKTTGTKSPHFITDRVDLYNTTSSARRVPAGTSIVPAPALTSSAFGIIQEKLWKEPFWLLIAVTFLNKTTGRAAVPIFWKVKKLFPSPEQLAEADPEVLLEMVKTLGLQNARSKRLISMAQSWANSPPAKGTMYRTLNYPLQGDGRAKDVPDMSEEDIEICKGSLEIGQMPGCGAYAYDSWRVFCRDVLRGVALDYDGKGADCSKEGFEPEWKRVLPGDKELRACLRWMWMREGWVWDPLTGEKRLANPEELQLAGDGKMCIEDEGERKFANIAVGADVWSPVKAEDAGDVPFKEED